MGKFRDHTIEEKRKLRNERQKRKRQKRSEERKALEAAKLHKANEDRREEVARLRAIAKAYIRKWREKCAENQRLKELLQKSMHRTPGMEVKSTCNNISSDELTPIDKESLLGKGSFGQCFIRTYTRLNIQVVEKQMSTSSAKDIIKEAQIMQLLSHPNIPTILGVQFDKQPFSIVMQFIGNNNLSSTVHDLLQQDVNILQRVEWIKISFNVADALAHVHKKGYLHCDIKSNNIVVLNGTGYLIDFGKACPATSSSAKKYDRVYPHIAPEVLRGFPSSKQSDIYSLATVLNKIGEKQQISTLLEIAQKCLDSNPSQRMTLTGIMSTLATQSEIPLQVQNEIPLQV